MREISVQGWLVAVDPVRTAARYGEQPVVRNSCMCAYCRNFRAAMLTDAGGELAKILRGLEIPVDKVGDVSERGEGSADPRTHLYVGWYDLVGKVLVGHEDAELSAGVLSVSFHPWEETRTWVEAPNAPEDSIVLSFSIELPWVLDELP